MYIAIDSPICLQLDKQVVARAFSRAWAKTGKRIAARIAMIAMTTSSSIRVNACRRRPLIRTSSLETQTAAPRAVQLLVGSRAGGAIPASGRRNDLPPIQHHLI